MAHVITVTFFFKIQKTWLLTLFSRTMAITLFIIRWLLLLLLLLSIFVYLANFLAVTLGYVGSPTIGNCGHSTLYRLGALPILLDQHSVKGFAWQAGASIPLTTKALFPIPSPIPAPLPLVLPPISLCPSPRPSSPLSSPSILDLTQTGPWNQLECPSSAVSSLDHNGGQDPADFNFDPERHKLTWHQLLYDFFYKRKIPHLHLSQNSQYFIRWSLILNF